MDLELEARLFACRVYCQLDEECMRRCLEDDALYARALVYVNKEAEGE